MASVAPTAIDGLCPHALFASDYPVPNTLLHRAAYTLDPWARAHLKPQLTAVPALPKDAKTTKGVSVRQTHVMQCERDTNACKTNLTRKSKRTPCQPTHSAVQSLA